MADSVKPDSTEPSPSAATQRRLPLSSGLSRDHVEESDGASPGAGATEELDRASSPGPFSGMPMCILRRCTRRERRPQPLAELQNCLVAHFVGRDPHPVGDRPGIGPRSHRLAPELLLGLGVVVVDPEQIHRRWVARGRRHRQAVLADRIPRNLKVWALRALSVILG